MPPSPDSSQSGTVGGTILGGEGVASEPRMASRPTKGSNAIPAAPSPPKSGAREADRVATLIPTGSELIEADDLGIDIGDYMRGRR